MTKLKLLNQLLKKLNLKDTFSFITSEKIEHKTANYCDILYVNK